MMTRTKPREKSRFLHGLSQFSLANSIKNQYNKIRVQKEMEFQYSGPRNPCPSINLTGVVASPLSKEFMEDASLISPFLSSIDRG